MGVRQGRNATEEAVENEGSDPMVSAGFQREQTAETQKQLGKHKGEAAAQIPCPAIWLPVSPLTPFGCLGFSSRQCWSPLPTATPLFAGFHLLQRRTESTLPPEKQQQTSASKEIQTPNHVLAKSGFAQEGFSATAEVASPLEGKKKPSS